MRGEHLFEPGAVRARAGADEDRVDDVVVVRGVVVEQRQPPTPASFATCTAKSDVQRPR
jgi:hypothetical protein